MLSLDLTIGGLMVARYIVDLNPQDSLEILPEVGDKAIAIVTGDGLAGSVPGQPRPNEGVAAVEGGSLRHRYTLEPFRFPVHNSKEKPHSFRRRERPHYINVEVMKPCVWHVELLGFWYVFLF